MAKLALINRNKKRRATVTKFAVKRAELLAVIGNQKLSQDERYEARLKLREFAMRGEIPGVIKASW